MEKINKKRRALILYATMSSNTEKVANWFAETFDEYNWAVKVVKVQGLVSLEAESGNLYFDDYDVICLGSPIVGGAPLQPIIKAFSLGAGGNLEKIARKEMEKPDEGMKQQENLAKSLWRRAPLPYPGVLNKNDSRPLGIVFSTYGGGFFGSGECIPVLETLRLYLNNYSVDVVGYFACAGREHGPAGYAPGVKPRAVFKPGPPDLSLPEADVCDPMVYTMKDGTQKYGSYFFHFDLNSKPSSRDEAKARAFAGDFIEDYFMTYDGNPNPPYSKIISIS